MRLKRFTLIGATTRSGMLSGPMRDRFKMQEHLEYYTADELSQIVTLNAKKLNTVLAPEAAVELAQRSRGTPALLTQGYGGQGITPIPRETAL